MSRCAIALFFLAQHPAHSEEEAEANEDLRSCTELYVARHEQWLKDRGLLKGGTVLGLSPRIAEVVDSSSCSSISQMAPMLTCGAAVNPNLTGTILSEKNLAFANLANSDLKGVDLRSVVSMRSACFLGADLQDVDLTSVDLARVDFTDANLRSADLTGANLKGATLIRANLNEAVVKDAILAFVNLQDAIYSPNPTGEPSKEVVGITFVHTVQFGTMRESGMAQLRKIFKDLHLNDLERDATFAIRQYRSSEIEWVFFQLPVAWGRRPGRALIILLSTIVASMVYYAIVIRSQTGGVRSCGKSRIFRVRLTEHLSEGLGTTSIGESPCVVALRPKAKNWCAYLGWGLWFSVLSAFHIGWRDLNVGAWLSSVQPREFSLRGQGLVRVISGVQAVLSVYLLGLWALTYFARPFE